MKVFSFASNLLYHCKTAEPIENKSDYTRVKRWVGKATSWYAIFTVLAVLITAVVLGTASKSSDAPPAGVLTVAVPLICLLCAWGGATMILNFKGLFKSTWSAGVDGYRAGEQIQTHHVNVTHEYGDRYRVTTTTENEGCITAMMSGAINLSVWAFLCVYVCPFLTFKKISNSKKNLRAFEATQR